MKNSDNKNLTIAICILGLTLISMVGLTFYSLRPSPQYSSEAPTVRAVPTWIEYSERIVGDSHPTYTSTINRPAKQVWNCYTSEHNTDCTHKPLPNSQWALTGTGTGSLATHGAITRTWHDNYSSLMLRAVVKFDKLDRAETIYVRSDNRYAGVIFSFRKLASNKLGFGYGTANYSSFNPVFTDRNIGLPMEVGVSWDWEDDRIWFSYNGYQEEGRTASFATITTTAAETHKLGAGWDGDIFFLSFARFAHVTSALGEVNPEIYYTPFREGLSQCPNCIVQYNLNEGAGATTLIDRVYEQYTAITHINQNLTTINGTWTVYEQGY